MRFPIRFQLGTLLLLSSLIGISVISLATWVQVHDFVLSVRASRLALTASLKSAQLSSNLNLMQSAASVVTTRILVQRALMRYNYYGNNSAENWNSAQTDMQAAIGGDGSIGQTLLLQSMVFPKNATGVAGNSSLMRTTSAGTLGQIQLPYKYPNGTNIMLGANDTDAGQWGFPPMLYPNMTTINDFYNSTADPYDLYFDGTQLKPGSAMLLGPWALNSSFAMVSLTMPIVNNSNPMDIVGFLTVLMDAVLISDVIQSREGLDETGECLILCAATQNNLFPPNALSKNSKPKPNFPVKYVLPLNDSDHARHPDQLWGGPRGSFSVRKYPTMYRALDAVRNGHEELGGADLWAKNEKGQQVSVGWALPKIDLVDWVVIVELERSEVWSPIDHLRAIILACLFATAGFMAVIAYPLAHFFALPILRLRQATSRSIKPPGPYGRDSMGSYGSDTDGNYDDMNRIPDDISGADSNRKGGLFKWFKNWNRSHDEDAQTMREERKKREFRIPQKVKHRRQWFQDELSDLTGTFNEMSDELMMQYTRLEERVQQRTAELELSKKAAEAANESKTLFIANISHELKTPLNGILGMTAVCMQEDDPIRIKRSLGIIYKSGDLLFNLLTDLLTFSKNEVGQHLTLDEKEFYLREITAQTKAIFDKQASEKNIDFRIVYEGIPRAPGDDPVVIEPSELGPDGTGKICDMKLLGDVHRILQIVINLVSNSLKFTPEGGTVTLILRCLAEMPTDIARRSSSRKSKTMRRASRQTRASDGVSIRSATRYSSTLDRSAGNEVQLSTADAAASPSSPNLNLYFEFEVVDTGPGIAENLQKQIFEPFVQGDLRLSKKFGGTGLGLSICSQLANLMHGSIRVHSVVDEGATFTLKIPLMHVKSNADSSASSMRELFFDDLSRHNSVRSERRTHGTAIHERRETPDVSEEYPEPSPGASAGENKMQGTECKASESQPRLVGLSTPFFSSAQPINSPGLQGDTMQVIAADGARVRSGRIRVLVAEDNQVNQEVVLRMLKLEDIYDVTLAKDGQEALDLVKASMTPQSEGGTGGVPFNLIFMDVQMPNVVSRVVTNPPMIISD
jgi:osomolarity two-component system sensor histidine kinase SLN1